MGAVMPLPKAEDLFSPQAVKAAASRPKALPKAETLFTPPSFMDRAKHSLALGAGGVAAGIADIPGMLANPLNAGLNWTGLPQKLTGHPLGTDLGGAARRAVGAPEPGNRQERFTDTGIRSAMGGLTGSGVARGVAAGTKGVTKAVAKLVASSPKADVISSAASGLAGQSGREHHLPWYSQAAVELGAGMFGAHATGLAGRAREGLANPRTVASRKSMVETDQSLHEMQRRHEATIIRDGQHLKSLPEHLKSKETGEALHHAREDWQINPDAKLPGHLHEANEALEPFKAREKAAADRLRALGHKIGSVGKGYMRRNVRGKGLPFERGAADPIDLGDKGVMGERTTKRSLSAKTSSQKGRSNMLVGVDKDGNRHFLEGHEAEQAGKNKLLADATNKRTAKALDRDHGLASRKVGVATRALEKADAAHAPHKEAAAKASEAYDAAKRARTEAQSASTKAGDAYKAAKKAQDALAFKDGVTAKVRAAAKAETSAAFKAKTAAAKKLESARKPVGPAYDKHIAAQAKARPFETVAGKAKGAWSKAMDAKTKAEAAVKAHKDAPAARAHVRLPNGEQWAVKRPTTREIEANTSVRYTKDALHDTVDNAQRLERAADYAEFIADSKSKLIERGLAQKLKEGERPPAGMKVPDMPQFAGLAVDDRTARVLNEFYGKKGTQPVEELAQGLETVSRKINATMFFTPVPHARNVATHWFAARGWDWVTPKGTASLVRNGIKTIKAMKLQDGVYADILDHGGNLPSAKIFTEEHQQALHQAFAEDIAKGPNKEGWKEVAKMFGTNSAGLVRSLYRWSSKSLWVLNDAFVTHRTLENIDKGMSMKQAIDETEKDIPNYRIPPEIAGSAKTAAYFKSNLLQSFGRYRYGIFKALGHTIKPLIQSGASRQEVIEASGKLFMTAVSVIAAQEINEKLRKATGNAKANAGEPGYIKTIGAAEDFASGAKTWEQAMGSVDVTPWWLETFNKVRTNRGYGGYPVIKDGEPVAGQVASLALDATSPGQTVDKLAHGQGADAAASLVGARYPQKLTPLGGKPKPAELPKAEDLFSGLAPTKENAPLPKAEDLFSGLAPTKEKSSAIPTKAGAMNAGSFSSSFKPIATLVSQLPGFGEITGGNDSYHQRGDAHREGRAMDVNIKGGRAASAAFAANLKQRLRDAGYNNVFIQNEYLHPSARATAGHIHVQLPRSAA